MSKKYCGIWKYSNGATCSGLITDTIFEQEKLGLLKIVEKKELGTD
ncbi:hypothetical protein MUP77_15540 [Candidatus Bathyarchaeota archaeon]|nr:hypothetical protein [Candidatus Bathyarchaeota archaeon]